METIEENKQILSTYFSRTINLKFEFPEEGIKEPKIISVDENDLLETACDKLLYQLKSPKFQNNSNHFFYLKKNNERKKELQNRKIGELCLNEEDVILVSYKRLLIPFTNLPFFDSKKDSQNISINIDSDPKNNYKKKHNIKNTSKTTVNEIVYKKNKRSIKNAQKQTIYKPDSKEGFKKKRSIKNIKNMPNNVKNQILFIKILLFLIFLILIGGIIYIIIKLFKYKKKKEPVDLIFDRDKMIINKKYPTNLFMRFTSKKQISIVAEGNGIDEETSKNNILQISDFIFIVRENHTEVDAINKIEKEWYTAYIAFINITLKNKTNDMMLIYDKELNENIVNKNKRRLEEKNDIFKSIQKEGNICFAKMDFYQNGEIKNYYIPQNFTNDNFIYIKDVANLIIPQISSNLYVKSINESLNEYLTSDNDNNENSKGRRLSKSYEKSNEEYKVHKTIIYNSSNGTNYSESYSIEKVEIEKYLTEPLTDSMDIDLREANVDNSTNYSNLVQYSMKNVETDEIKMEDSLQNTTTNSYINEEGILESVYQIITTSFRTPNPLEDDEEDAYTAELNRRIFDDNNQISMNDIKNNNEEESQFNINLNISSLLLNNSHIINCSEYFIDEEFNNKLYNYFDTFTYELYNEKEDKIQIDNLEDNINNTRNLEEINEYYGMKKTAYTKQIYKYNLIGLRMEKQILTEINPSNGITSSYAVLIFGNKNLKIKINEQHSNMHIITEKKNQMGYNLILLLEQSNKDLIEKSINYLDVIINLEKNMTNFYKNEYDFSNLFNDSLYDMYANVQNFSGNFFKELINLINNVYDNYSMILIATQENKYDIINKIKEITKDEYINYIYNSLNVLEIFKNNTFIFLEDIENKLENITDFQIDLLYDIKDNLYEANLIFKQFNVNLFKSIEKGIITLKYDMEDYIEELIGDLLYITDFLSVNINKNEILKKAIEDNIREEAKIKLKNLRNIILTIIDMMICEINNDYQKEINLANNDGIKYYSYQKAEQFLMNTNKKSYKVINDITDSIDNYHLFELYSNNINIINDIINKTIIEFYNEIYNNIIYNSINLESEYYNNNSSININKNQLFEISKNIVSEINKDIYEIDYYIFNNVKNFMDKNLYDLYYNLYYFKKYFITDGIKILSNSIDILLSKLINSFIKSIININFRAVMNRFNEVEGFIDNCKKKRKFIGTRVTEGYENALNDLEKILEKLSSGNLSELIINKISILINNIINDIKNKLLSIRKYYFINELYTDNFYLYNLIYNEFIKLVEIFNNNFDEKYIINLQIKVTDMISNNLINYHNSKTQELIDCYNSILEKLYKEKIKNTRKWDLRCQSIWGITYFWERKYSSWQFNFNNDFDVIEIPNYLKISINEIFSKFKSKYEKYLNNFISISDLLYSNLYSYMQNKINSNEIFEKLLKKYEIILNDIINNDSNDGLLTKIYNKNYTDKIIIYMTNLNENINKLNERYYKYYYLNNRSYFLEYPKEIIYKINQFLYEVKNISILVKDIINTNYQKKIKNIILSTNTYIFNFIKNNLNYILIHLNKNNIINEYISIKYNKITNTFNKFINNLNLKNYNLNENDNLFFKFQYYDEQINIIINNTETFILYLENKINDEFVYDNCSDIDNEMNQNKSKICINKTREFVLNISKYNYNIVKLREGLYDSKTKLENIDKIINQYNFEDLINNEKIIYSDNLLNDKNILNIYGETNNKLFQINKESYSLIEEYFQSFIEEFKKKYTYKNDYINLRQKFLDIITLKDNHYKLVVENAYNNTLNDINKMLDEFNITLYKQILLISKYDYYNFNQTYYQLIFKSYKVKIGDIFNKYKNIINSLKSNYKFNNLIISIFRNFQNNKREYFKSIINDFSKKYNFYLLNITYDLGDFTKRFMEKDYYDYEITNVYDYVEIFEKYRLDYIKKIIIYVNNLENNIQQKFKKIYDEFYDIFKNRSSNYINIKLIEDLEYNKSICKDYSYELLKDKKDKNEIYLEHYNRYMDIINLIFIKCYNSINNNTYDIDNYSFYEKIDYINEIRDICFNIILNSENKSYYNELSKSLNCYNNNYYNYTMIYFNNFSYKNELDNVMNNIETQIKNNYLDENFLFDYLNCNYQLEAYNNITIKDLSFHYDQIENIISYINIKKNEEYKEYLFNLLINSFNSSYLYLIDNYITNKLISNVTVLINSKIEFIIKYVKQNLINEYYYYKLILNDADEIGNSSKNALIGYYDYIINRLNDTIFYLIEDINFYLDIFQKDYNKILKKNFINYYSNNLNQYNISIFKLDYFYDEIILDKNFNKKISLISTTLVEELIIQKIKNEINNVLNSKIQNLFNLTELLKIKMKNSLDNINIKPLSEDMYIINELIINYTEILNAHNNHYILKISDKPLIQIYDFISINLEPPLILIKDKYNEIEQILLSKILNIVQDFPDFYSILKEELQLENIYRNITLFLELFESYFMKYDRILSDGFNDYINKLIHYTFINGLHTFDQPCIYSFCKINFDKNSIRRNEEEEEKINKKKIKYDRFEITINKTEINKLKNKKIRKLDGYDYTMGAITEVDIIDYLLNINETISNFIQIYLGDEYKNITKISHKFINRINNTYLQFLKKSIDLVSIRFSTILTRENYNILEKYVYEKYNEIQLYINNNSDLIANNENKFENLLYKSSYMLYYSFNISYYKVRGYYLLLCDTIQNQMKILSEKEIKENKKRILNETDDISPNNINDLKRYEYFYEHYIFIYREIETKSFYLIETFEEYIRIERQAYPLLGDAKKGEIISSVFTDKKFKAEIKPGITMNKDKMDISISICLKLLDVKFNDYFVFPIKFTFFDLVLSIIPSVGISACIKSGFDLNWKENEYLFYIDICGKAEASVSLDAGVYVPFYGNPITVSAHIGIHGLIGSGEVGIKLSLFLNKDNFDVDLYSKIKAFEFSLYLVFRITISFKKLKILKFLEDFTYEFNLFSHTFLTLINYEYHLERSYKYNRQLISNESHGLFTTKLDFHWWKIKYGIPHD